MCAYKALEFLLEVDPAPPDAPLVRQSNGKSFTREHLQEMVKAEATRQSLTPLTAYTAYSLRIGGATDRLDSGATEADIRKAGRWDSDVAEVYARPSVARLVSTSLAAYDARGADIESAVPGYTQAARV